MARHAAAATPRIRWMTAAGNLRWRAPRTVVLATGDLLAGGGEHVPAGPECLGALAVGDAGAGVTGEGVQRAPGVGELMHTACPQPGERPGHCSTSLLGESFLRVSLRDGQTGWAEMM